MNEQLVVKNFGPIKDATVDFKRVTVFIGPTGGGKSTLAKLAAVFRDKKLLFGEGNKSIQYAFKELTRTYEIDDYHTDKTQLSWKKENDFTCDFSKGKLTILQKALRPSKQSLEKVLELNAFLIPKHEPERSRHILAISDHYDQEDSFGRWSASNPIYIPADRTFISAVQGSLAGLQTNKIALPETLVSFAAEYELARKFVSKLLIPFFNVTYVHRGGVDMILTDNRKAFKLSKSASGLQACIPVLLITKYQMNPLGKEKLSAKSFIIEEPELNLFPTGQTHFLEVLIEQCTHAGDELTITTHSPYILSSCNLLLEAYKVAQQRPELADEIDKIVPRACWLNPDEFAAYYVADGTVKAITDERTHLIGGNELDAVSGDISDSFRRLLQLKKQVA